jgi:ATP-binding cassette, subfamily C (CFTR/MRP), member 1
MIRGGLASIIYKKTLSLDIDAKAESAPVTLMSTDIDGLAMPMSYIHDMWVAAVDLGLAIYLLDWQVGHASFLVVIPGVGA